MPSNAPDVGVLLSPDAAETARVLAEHYGNAFPDDERIQRLKAELARG